MANLINEAEIRDTWSPIIESATGITDASKLAWMSEYCHNHKLYEDANIMALSPGMNIGGMGAVSFPSGFGASPATKGSGDKAPTLLPLAMQVAAQTIGLDLVPVVPMAGPMGLLSYLDFVYEGGRLAGSTVAPTYIKCSDSDLESDQAGTADFGILFDYVGTSRIDGKYIYKITGTLTGGKSVQEAADAARGAAAGTVELVKALEDHIAGFVGNADESPYDRATGESTPEKLMGLSLFSKSVEAKTYQVAAAVTREQVQDLKQFGVDAVAQVEAVLVNELTQTINDLIINKIGTLGASNISKSVTAGEIPAGALTVKLVAANVPILLMIKSLIV